MKALIIHNAVHSTFPDDTFTTEQEAALPTWNNGNPAPDAIVSVPQDWEPFVNETFTWTAENGLTEPTPGYVLGKAKDAKYTEFDTVFQKVDLLKIRPASSISEAFSKGLTPDKGDVYVLSETQAIATENRRRRDLVSAAETVEAVRAVSVWWPE